jgi:hypothetical protein
MKLHTAVALAAFVILAACQVKVEENVQAAAENQMEALQNEAAEITADAENGVSDVANTLENQAAALQDEVTGDNEPAANAAAGNPANSQ